MRSQGIHCHEAREGRFVCSEVFKGTVTDQRFALGSVGALCFKAQELLGKEEY